MRNDIPPSPKSKFLPTPAKKKRKKRTVTCAQAAAALAKGKATAFALLLMALLLPAPAHAQGNAGNFAYSYDVESATPTYCKLTGQNGGALTAPLQVVIPIETSGSSTTVTAVTATTAPFAALAVGDAIFVQTSTNSRETRVITAKATADSVTIQTAADWSAGYTFSWLDLSCGTGAEAGWIGVEQFSVVQMTVQYDAGDLDTLDFALFCKEGALGSMPVRVYPGISADCGDGTLSGTHCEFANPGERLSYKIPHNAFAQCRISLSYGSTDGVTREQVTATLSVVQ